MVGAKESDNAEGGIIPNLCYAMISYPVWMTPELS